MVEMRNSGYSEKYRYDTLVNTLKGYRRKVKAEEEGVAPLYREGHVGARTRYMARIGAPATWFKRKPSQDEAEEMGRPILRRNPWRKEAPKGGRDDREIEGVIFIPHTSNSNLQRVLQQTDDLVTRALGMPRTRYVERGGLTIKDLLVRKNPWFRLGGGCGRPTCHVCQSQGGKGTTCRREGTCYQIECKQCDELEGGVKTWYIGETSRSTMERMKEHLWLFNHKKEGDPTKDEASSALWIHSRDCHQGAMVGGDWRSKVVSTHFGALNRQVTEAVKISRGGGERVRLLNNKQEFGANLLLEVVVMRGDQILGRRNGKRRRNGAEKREACISTLVQSYEGGEDGAG